jgi:cullin 1
MVVLLLFNKLPSWTVERMQDETQIKADLFLQVLCGLLKSKLITSPEINDEELEEEIKENDIKMNYNIQIAEDFKRYEHCNRRFYIKNFLFSKKIKINLNVPLKSVEQKDIEGLHRTIDEDRKMVIQAAIVRTMKARQTLKHALLMQEVIQQLSSRFKPKIPVIKVNFIKNFIEKSIFFFCSLIEMY